MIIYFECGEHRDLVQKIERKHNKITLMGNISIGGCMYINVKLNRDINKGNKVSV